MKLTNEEKKHIASGAAFIDERIAGAAVLAEADCNMRNQENELLTRWRVLTSHGGNYEGFNRRMQLLGKNPAECIPFLGKVSWNNAVPLPEWLVLIDTVLEKLPASTEEIMKKLPIKTFSVEKPEPYQEIWSPWLLACHDIFIKTCPNYNQFLSECALKDWLRYILNILNKNFALCLTSSFDHLRFNNFIFLNNHNFTSLRKNSSLRYQEFCQRMLSGEWIDFLKNYPVAARLISTVCTHQALYFADVIKNLNKDVAKISLKFNVPKPGYISRVKAGLSDHHNNGKSVIKFEFQNGLNLFYKPRYGNADTLWANIIKLFEKKMPDIKFKLPTHLEGDGYTWVEEITNSSLQKIEDASLFYYKAGALLAIIYTLGGIDFHQENLIADGCDPVFIDLETLLNPLVKPFNHKNISDTDKNNYLNLDGDSVLRTCILPLWTQISKDVSRDYGALTPDDNVPYSTREWIDINTDKMRRAYINRNTGLSPNVPQFNGSFMNVMEYKNDILNGFSDYYKTILSDREGFIKEISSLSENSDAYMRSLPRQSQIYGDMIERLRSPGLMRNGAAYSIEAEGLAKPFLNAETGADIEKLWKIYDAERRSVLFMNIPLFIFSCGSHSVNDESGIVIEDYYIKSAIERMKIQIEKLSSGDMEYQLSLIEASLAARFPDFDFQNNELKFINTENASKMPELNNKKIISTARDIAQTISDRVILKNGRPQWLTLKNDPVRHYNYIGPSDITLYDGSTGIGLFLAAYEKITGDSAYHELAVKCFDEFLEFIKNSSKINSAAKYSLGYTTGISGILWALYNSGKYLDESRLLKSAKKGLALFKTCILSHDSELDIMGGAAGGAITAAAFYKLSGDKKLLKFAEECAKYLLAKHVKYEKWLLWPSAHAYKPLTGFAHGASGYALALAKVYDITDNDLFKEAALEACNYETACYSPDYQNWPDFRNKDKSNSETVPFMHGWCSGAPGIGFSRLELSRIINSPQFLIDIENSIEFSKNFKAIPNFRDHLCCGYSSQIEFLIEASIVLKRPELLKEARRQFSFIINRAEKNGRYTLQVDESKSIFTPGLFTGLAGIGYVALRIAAGDKLSTILAPR